MRFVRWCQMIPLRLHSLFHRSRVEQDLDEEMQHHLERQIENNIANGMTPDTARYAALRAFGGLEQRKEECRDARHLNLIESVIQDLHYAVRTLRKNLGFSVVAVFTLAVSVGANTAIFSALKGLFNPPGVSEPERVVAVLMNVEKINLRNSVISPRDFTEVRDSKEIFATAAISQTADFSYVADGVPERLAGRRVTWQWFEVLGAKPILGRDFRPEEDQPNSNQVVILTHNAWQRLFGGDRSVIGRTIQLNQLPYKVIGIMGPEHDIGMDFNGAEAQDIFVPLGLPPQDYAPGNRFNQSYIGLARLQRGVRFEKAQAFMGVLTERGFQDPFGQEAKKGGWSLFIRPYTDYVGGDIKTAMYALFGAVAFVLLISCSNIAGLMLARASARSREFAVRAALGANRWRLIRQTLVESLVLAVGGSILGLGVAYISVVAIPLMAPQTISGRLKIELDVTVLVFTVTVGIVSGVLFGIAPAWQVAQTNTHDALREGTRSGTASRNRLRFRSTLVTAEIGLALVLMVGAGLFLRSLVQLQQVDLGFQPKGVMSGVVTLPASRYKEPARQIAFYQATVNRLSTLPGVTSAAAALPLPFLGGSAANFQVLGRVQQGEIEPHADIRWVTPGFFSTLQIPLKSGRLFTDFDTTSSEDVAVIDESLAQQYWPNQDPLGQRIQTTEGTGPAKIVGVVGHAKSSVFATGLAKGVICFPMYQRPLPIAAMIVRTDADPTTLGDPMRLSVRSVDPFQPISNLKTMDERVAETLGVRRFAVLLLGAFAAVALFMAALGLYGVINYGVRQRIQEIGIRMALGARDSQVVISIVGQGFRIALIGIGFGLIAAFVLARFVSTQFFGVNAVDPLTFVGMTIGLVAVALLASYIPARRATKVNPIEACRYE